MLESEDMKAHVQDGQIVLDEPLDLPDGTRLRIVTEDDDAALEAAIIEGIEDIRAGRASDFGEFLEELKAEDRAEA